MARAKEKTIWKILTPENAENITLEELMHTWIAYQYLCESPYPNQCMQQVPEQLFDQQLHNHLEKNKLKG